MVTRCKPLTKDHLLLKTAFAGTKGWSLVTGFTVFVCLCVCVMPGAIPYLSFICDYKGSTGLYITAGHNICWLPYLSRTVPYKQLATIFDVSCIRLPDVEGNLERNRETRRK